MTKVLVATAKPFAPKAVEEIRKIVEKAGYELKLLEKYTELEALIDAVKDVEALIVRSDKVTKDVLSAAEQLKIVVRAGAGYDNLDLDAASEKNVCAMNTPGQNSNAVAELAIGMMIYLARNGFNGKPGSELRGKKLGIHAYGHVGRYVAIIAKGFGMEIYAYDPFVEKMLMQREGIIPVSSTEELYEKCDYVSLHIPSNATTKQSINYNLLSKMPENATLINTARKEVVCEESLKKIMNERKDFRYASDIAPDCASEIAESFPEQFFFTPKKMGAQTAEANINAGIAAATQIVNFIEKNDRTFQVNK